MSCRSIVSLLAAVAGVALSACELRADPSVSSDGGSAGERAAMQGPVLAGRTQPGSAASVLALDFQLSSGGPVQLREASERMALASLLPVEGVGDATSRADAAVIARALTHDERDAGLVATPVAFEAVALVVRADNPLRTLRLQDVRAIFTGSSRTWHNGRAVVAFASQEVSGAGGLYREVVLGGGPAGERVVPLPSALILDELRVTPGSIGLMPVSELAWSDTSELRVLAIDGVDATEREIALGRYGLSRPVCVVTAGEPTGTVGDLIAFSQSESGRMSAERQGRIGLSTRVAALVRSGQWPRPSADEADAAFALQPTPGDDR